MGNGFAKQLTHCFSGDVRRHVAAAVTSEPYDEGLGHSFCYLRPDLPSSEKTTTFRSISGASVSANASTPLSTSLIADLNAAADTSAAAFESSVSFAAVPLQPIPRFPSGPLSGPLAADRGFLSGPIERGFMSGPLDSRSAALFSGPLDRLPSARRRLGAASILRGLSKAISRTLSIAHASNKDSETGDIGGGGGDEFSSSDAVDSTDPNLQWAQGKAGEDRVHVVISEDYGWVFVGIYDGFNGPDATDHLLSNLYPAVHRELKGLLWDEEEDTETPVPAEFGPRSRPNNRKQTRWKYEFDNGEKRSVLDQRLEEQLSGNHAGVLKALSLALRRTEDSYLDSADETLSENPELALMGSCVLAMLMKGEDVYLMNVGDSRAVLARNKEPELWSSAGKVKQDLHRINEEVPDEFGGDDESGGLPGLAAVQLTIDHSTCVEEEVQRIRTEHRDDASAIANDRVKGSLKVTRAFGAGFLKQPKWNNALLEVFRIDYVGTSPYITCTPSLYHHKLGPKDRFLILSSDGLYQYFTNEQAVAEVELFISLTPEGDPAQHLVEEVLFRAANKAGMEFHELLEIPQGDRRRYHDDVSIIVISFEGRIWKSCL